MTGCRHHARQRCRSIGSAARTQLNTKVFVMPVRQDTKFVKPVPVSERCHRDLPVLFHGSNVCDHRHAWSGHRDC